MLSFVRLIGLVYVLCFLVFFFFFSSRRRHTRFDCDWSSDVCSSDLLEVNENCRLAFYYSFQHAREGDLAGLLRCSKGKSQNSCRKAAYNKFHLDRLFIPMAKVQHYRTGDVNEFDELNLYTAYFSRHHAVFSKFVQRPENGVDSMHHRGSCLRPACGEWIHMYWIEIAGQTGEENLVVLIERSGRQRYAGHTGYRSIALVLATIAPTSSNDSMSATPNFTPSSISTAAMKLM